MNGNEEKLEQLEKEIKELSAANKEVTNQLEELAAKLDTIIITKMDNPNRWCIKY